VYLEIQNGISTQIDDPLSATSIEDQTSTVPKISTEKVVTNPYIVEGQTRSGRG